jgi:transposase InsO family protein
MWLGATARSTAELVTRQLTEACGWKAAPQYVVRDRDAVYADVFIRRLRAMGIRDRLTAARSPWQNRYAERLIGSIRRECLDYVVVFGERHLCHLLKSYQIYYNEARTHLSLRRMRRFRAVLRPLAAFSACRSWADCTINTSGFDFR